MSSPDQAVAAAAIAQSATISISDQVAAAVAQVCLQAQLLGLALANGLGNPCTADAPLFVTGGNVMEPSEHDLNAVAGRPGWALLQRETPPHSRSWLYTSAALPACPTPRPSGQECDEYPFASAVEGGQFNHPSLKLVNVDQNQSQGRALKYLFYDPCHILKDQRYFVLPVPIAGVPTFGVCRV